MTASEGDHIAIGKLATAGVVALAMVGAIIALTRPAPPPASHLSPREATSMPEIDPGGIPGVVPDSCPVTIAGEDAFAPASKAPEGPPSVYDEVWYGTPELWTMINPRGEIDSKRWLDGDRTFWWSESYSPEDPGEVVVTARRLNGPAPIVEERMPGGSGFNPFMTMPTHDSVTMVGVQVPMPGCWELTAEYKGAALGYVFWITDRD